MENNGTYRIHVDSFLRLSELFGEWSDKDDLYIEVPNIEGLDDAVCLVNKACSMKLWRQQEQEFEMFTRTQFAKIKQFIESGERDTEKAKELIAETANYYKRKRAQV